MTDDHVEAFLGEAEEQITDLNNSLLRFESNPDDREAMDSIFRTAHTLKGNFGAMGFEAESRLAHALEDLLDELRQDRLEPTPAVMDLAFEGVDGIEATVRGIDAEGESTVDPEPIVEALRGAIENGGVGSVESASGARSAGAQDEIDALFEDCTDDESVFEARVEPRDGEMAGVEAMLAAEAIEETFGRVAFEAEIEALSGPFSVAIVATDGAAIETALAEVGRIETATVERLDAPESAAGSETGVEPIPSGKTDEEIRTVRVDVDRLDELHGLVEQLVTSRIKLRRTVEEDGELTAEDAIDELDKITASLQNVVMDVRLIPLEKVVSKLPRLVRDLAREEGKRIEFTMTGEDVELDRTILSQLSDPLMHILRNAVDHGIEPPEERGEKEETGEIELRATRDRDHVVIEIEDDGRGIDREAIERKAIETGIHTAEELAAFAPEEVYELIFHPGFSTAEEITDVSGRGVGMDVVYSTVEALDGRIGVESDHGEGTLVRLRLPVTVAIVNVLFVRVGEESFGVPVKAVDEIGRASGIETINGREVIDHDDEIYPVIELREALGVDGGSKGGMLVRTRKTERPVALRCEDVRRQEEVVVKPLDGVLSGTPGLGGTAILGDGEIVPILDVRTL